MSKKQRVKLNVPMKGHPAGSTIVLDFNGKHPVDKFWRDRFNDVAIEAKKAESLKKKYTPSIEVVAAQPSKKVNSDAQ